MIIATLTGSSVEKLCPSLFSPLYIVGIKLVKERENTTLESNSYKTIG
jgi:hypothetical protein